MVTGIWVADVQAGAEAEPAGGVLSTVTLTLLSADPPALCTTTRTVCGPSGQSVVFHFQLKSVGCQATCVPST